jgi:hypothetical protein
MTNKAGARHGIETLQQKAQADTIGNDTTTMADTRWPSMRNTPGNQTFFYPHVMFLVVQYIQVLHGRGFCG